MKKLFYAFAALVVISLTACNEEEFKKATGLTFTEAAQKIINEGIPAPAEGFIVNDFLFKSDIAWTAGITFEGEEKDWIEFSPKSGGPSDDWVTLNIVVKQNTSVKSRTANVTISVPGLGGVGFKVVQEGIKEGPSTGTIILNKTQLNLVKEETFKLIATDKDGNNLDVTWSTTNDHVARVDKGGTVTGHDLGECEIIATFGKESASCNVKVSDVIGVKSLTFDVTELTLNIGETYTLTPIFFPENATYKNIYKWLSRSTHVATVDDNGTVTAIAKGQTEIVAGIDKEGSIMAECSVTVVDPNDILVESIVLDKTEITMKKGEKVYVTATLTPSNTTFSCNWKSDNPEIATASPAQSNPNQAWISAISEGTTTINVYAGYKKATITVTVEGAPAIAVESVTVNPASLELEVGQTATLTATVFPENASDKNVTWSCSNPEVVQINNGNIYATKAGTATITATAGGKSGTCTVTVNEVEIVSVSFSQTSKTLYVGQSWDTFLYITPASATPVVTWTSSNPDVVEVSHPEDIGLSSSAERLTAKAVGTATITAEAGGKSATMTVTVEEPFVTYLNIVEENVSFSIGRPNPFHMTVEIHMSGGVDPIPVTWSSDDPSIASVDQNGNVTPVAIGKTVIRATAGDKSDYCQFEVTQ